DECRSSICIKNSDIPYCSEACANESDCPQDFVCRELNGMSVCLKEVSPCECYCDKDCPVGSFCSLTEEGDKREVKCSIPTGDYSSAGESCINPCSSGLCLSETSTCSAFCRSREDCPSDHVCVFAGLNISLQERKVVKICIPNPGSLYTCIRDEGCPDGEVCRVFFDKRSGEIEPVCMKLHRDLKNYSEICYSNEECRSGVCLPDSASDISSDFSGRCTRFCATDEDCVSNQICRIVPVYFSPEYAKSARICAPKPDKSAVGQSCSDDPYVCDSGFCANVDNSNSFCTERCRDHFDCVKSLTVCRLIDRIGTICLPVNYFQEE
ncbi:MAG: hypothetical protein N3B13_08620, partial [Deltaproteobacteria bacterium]|nr:hypothetical protein [Deltaproteobacteria bacterium]